MKPDGLRCNFQRLNNSYPFGYIYDDHGGMATVGAKIRSTKILETDRVNAFHSGFNALLDEGLCVSQIFDYNGKEVGYNQDNAIDGFPDRSSINDFLDMNPGSAKTTLFNLGIRGIVGLSAEVNNEQKKFFEGNTMDSTLLLRTDSTLSKVINLTNKNVEQLCRGKRQKTFDKNRSLICFDADNSTFPQ